MKYLGIVKVLPIVALMGAAVQPASASSFVIFGCAVSAFPQLTNLAPTAAVTVSCPKFDPALGTLLNYSVFSTGNDKPTGTLFATNLTSGTITAEASVAAAVRDFWNITSIGGTTHSVSDLLFATADPLGNCPCPITLAGNGSASFVIRGHGSLAAITSQTASLSSLVGIGTVQVWSVALSSLAVSGSNFNVASYSINPIDSSVTILNIAYVYDAPEPGTAALAIVAGLLVLLKKTAIRLG